MNQRRKRVLRIRRNVPTTASFFPNKYRILRPSTQATGSLLLAVEKPIVGVAHDNAMGLRRLLPYLLKSLRRRRLALVLISKQSFLDGRGYLRCNENKSEDSARKHWIRASNKKIACLGR